MPKPSETNRVPLYLLIKFDVQQVVETILSRELFKNKKWNILA